MYFAVTRLLLRAAEAPYAVLFKHGQMQNIQVRKVNRQEGLDRPPTCRHAQPSL